MIFGVSGSIGSGKTTAARYLSKISKIPLFEADIYGHQAYRLFSKTRQQIKKSFGTANRKQIAEIVFADKNKLDILNQITHPFIFREIAAKLDKRGVIDATLLFEIGLSKLTDVNILITADQNIIKNRLLKKGYDEQQITARLVAMPAFNAVDYDLVVDNSYDQQTFYEKIEQSLSQYL